MAMLEMQAMTPKPKCKVCGRAMRRFSDGSPDTGLCFGVHASCGGGNIKVTEALPVLFKIWDTRNPEKVWWCTDSGMRVIEKPDGLEEWLQRIGKLEFRG